MRLSCLLTSMTATRSALIGRVIVNDAGRGADDPAPRQRPLGATGGVLELSESILDGLRREVREETGLEIEPERLTGVYKNMPRATAAVTTSASNTPASPNDTASGSRSVGAGSAGTTPSPNHSSPRSRPNSCTVRRGRPAPPPDRRYSSTWKAGTTPAAGTPASATSAPPPTKPTPATRHQSDR
jgi:ADP-ribose pyrophosphatase YjhB (NUDIX family)